MSITSDHLDFIDEGNGPSTVVLLHGWCCRTGDFAAQVNTLSSDHRVVAIDWEDRMRARGSDRSFDGICRDIVDLLAEIDVRNPVVCGHSMGGYLASQLVTTYGLDARAVLCLDTTMPVTDPVKTAFGAWIDQLTPENLVQFYRTTGSMHFFKPNEISDTSRSIMAGMMSRPLDEARDLLAQVCAPEFVQDYASLTTSFHYVSSGLNPVSTESVITDLIPHATYERLEESGHFMTIFHPDRITGIITGIIAGSL